MVLVEEASTKDGLQVHQLLCGREIARNGTVLDHFAMQMANYVYVVVKDGVAAVIDPAWDTDGIFRFCKEKLGVEIRLALFTHRHFDHTGGKVPSMLTKQPVVLPGLADFVKRGVKVCVGKRDAEATAKQTGVSLQDIQQLEGGDSVDLCEGVRFHVIATPGHTHGSVCFELATKESSRVLFTGDTLFIGSCGRMDLPESNVGEMLGSLARLAELPSDTLVLPGHNYAMPAHSTIGAEKSTNAMMIQAIERYNQGKQARVNVEPVAALLPLPNYLQVVRQVFEQDSSHRHSVDPTQLESHF